MTELTPAAQALDKHLNGREVGYCDDCEPPESFHSDVEYLNHVARRVLDAVPGVPPDPPAVDRDELAREMYATQLREPLSQKHMRDAWDDFPHVRGLWLQRADYLIASGVLVAAADVRARALEDAERRMFGTEDGGFIGDGSEIPVGELRRLLWDGTDRAVSEREGDGGDG